MNQLRTIGAFMVVSAIICFVIAYDRYQNAWTTGKAIADQIEGFQFEGVTTPIETYVAGFAGVVLLVAGVRCFASWRAIKKAATQEDGLLKAED